MKKTYTLTCPFNECGDELEVGVTDYYPAIAQTWNDPGEPSSASLIFECKNCGASSLADNFEYYEDLMDQLDEKIADEIEAARERYYDDKFEEYRERRLLGYEE
jgi:hypothetical protein